MATNKTYCVQNFVLFVELVMICVVFCQKYIVYETSPEYEIKIEPKMLLDVRSAHDVCVKEGGELLEMNKRPDMLFINDQIAISGFTNSKNLFDILMRLENELFRFYLWKTKIQRKQLIQQKNKELIVEI